MESDGLQAPVSQPLTQHAPPPTLPTPVPDQCCNLPVQRKTFLLRALNSSRSGSSASSSSCASPHICEQAEISREHHTDRIGWGVGGLTVYLGIMAHLLFCRMAVTTAAISVLSSRAFS